MHYFVNKYNYCQICKFIIWFYWTLLIALTFAMKLKHVNCKGHSNILAFATGEKWCQISKCLLLFFSTFWVGFSHNTEKFWFWKSLKCFNIFWKKRYGIRFEYANGKMSDFVSLILFGFTLVIKLGIFNFHIHWNNFLMKKEVRFEFVLSNTFWLGLNFVVWLELWQ